MPFLQPIDGFAVITKACETHITVEICDLLSGVEILASEKAERCKKFLELWANLQKHIYNLDMERRLGVPLYYIIPNDYYNMLE